jgi:hypothetical protein
MADPTLQPTRILDYDSPELQQIVQTLSAGAPPPREYIQKAHLHLSDVMHPIYSVADQQPASETVRLNGGSCSQRMACLEALARGYGIRTRVRALWLAKEFWKERLPLLEPILPKTLMPRPQFWLEETWVDFDEIFDSIVYLCEGVTHAFTNAGASLFDAVRNQPVDLLGKSSGYSLAQFVVTDAGFFDTRDELMKKLDDGTWMGS